MNIANIPVNIAKILRRAYSLEHLWLLLPIPLALQGNLKTKWREIEKSALTLEKKAWLCPGFG